MRNALTREYFYCYSVFLFKFLKMDKGISFICYALHDKTLKPFWIFERDDELKKALKQYRDR